MSILERQSSQAPEGIPFTTRVNGREVDGMALDIIESGGQSAGIIEWIDDG
jgi:hypothetical protein